MSDRAFIDTNVVVYLFDQRSPAKKLIAGELMQGLVDEQVVPVVSTQVLEETYSTLTRKLRMNPAMVLAGLQRMEAASFYVETIDAPMIWRAATRSNDDNISFWDGLIVESAITAHCSVLYTEDLQNGRTFDSVTVRNPFA